ncbi:lipid II:glycine glycyltransferase FemX [Gemelliphila palaticanis]|uniref:Lipid II:glycine glycyltransferase n=1 Tax=Gemelliphila palaticanis TaxID=81950 RepID=A0ABX2T0I2_9BACL|nr:peptidoglycan bridge formation glycyltransferase FemA/FemB family protein [Gemella palaticanis]MBF0716228.1 peptidoglycan bridge formation glycyltransferase FemA/FemB family protein [Gemella palaticanis]NYS48158.1 peptidoglycan bridge formation glycyltransferase FemA/FemB family protein [Gemella palaticanis]
MKFIDDINLKEYNDFVTSNYNCNIFQSPQWVDVKNTWGYKRVAVVDNSDNILATAQILIRKGLWYLPRGPIMDYKNKDVLSFFLRELKIYAKRNKAKLLKIDIPEILKSAKLSEFKNTASKDNSKEILKIFNKERFKHKGFTLNMSDTIQPRFEVVSELDENYFTSLPKDTRRLIRDADKKFVVVEKKQVDNLDDFMYTLHCTEKRKGITLRSKDYFENFFELYKDDIIMYVSYINVPQSLKLCEEKVKELNLELESLGEKSPKKQHKLKEQIVSVNKIIELLSSLEYDKEKSIISSSFTVVYGNYAEMIYAGMDERFLKLPAQYKVYEESMKDAYSKGVKSFSTGGIEGTLDDSLLLFKSKFNPNIVEHYGEFDYAISKTYKLLYDYGLPLRRKLLKLLKK